MTQYRLGNHSIRIDSDADCIPSKSFRGRSSSRADFMARIGIALDDDEQDDPAPQGGKSHGGRGRSIEAIVAASGQEDAVDDWTEDGVNTWWDTSFHVQPDEDDDPPAVSKAMTTQEAVDRITLHSKGRLV